MAALDGRAPAGMTVSVDPSSAAPLRALGAEAFLGLAAGAGLVIATRAEAEVLAGAADPERAAAALAEGRDEVVLKLGAEGALWRSGAGETVRVPAAASPEPGRRTRPAPATRSPPPGSPPAGAGRGRATPWTPPARSPPRS